MESQKARGELQLKQPSLHIQRDTHQTKKRPPLPSQKENSTISNTAGNHFHMYIYDSLYALHTHTPGG